MNSTLAIVDHADDASTEGGYVIGDVQGKTCIMVDDILNTGATLARAANVLKETAQKKYMPVRHMDCPIMRKYFRQCTNQRYLYH